MTRSSCPVTFGTAGHVDHGKTALVRALTGVDTDRLPEEKARGLSIALGFAPVELDDGRAASIVDVPGHQGFIRTMVAGVAGIQAYILAIAADDGVMPQTIEHHTVLQSLGVTQGLIAITKADLADPTAAVEQASDLFGPMPTVVCSAQSQAGLSLLRATMTRVADLALMHQPETADHGFVMHIDRAFVMPGLGVIVTGTVSAGRAATGDYLYVEPGGRRVRIRGMHTHGSPTPFAEPGQRVALNLSRARISQIQVGQAITARGAVTVTDRMICDLNLMRTARARAEVRIHHGTQQTSGRIRRLRDGTYLVSTTQPLPCREGDALLVRRLSPADTLGGGRILKPLGDARPDAARREAPRTRTTSAQTPGLPAIPLPTTESLNLRDNRRTLIDTGALETTTLAHLVEAGELVRVGPEEWAAAPALTAATTAISQFLEANETVSLSAARDILQCSRSEAEAILAYMDRQRLTIRQPDMTRRGRGQHRK